VREPVSDVRGILRTGTLGHIRFFWPFNHIALKKLFVEVVLAVGDQSSFFRLLLSFPNLCEHFFVFPSYLFAGSGGEVGVYESEIWAIELDELNCLMFTSSNLTSSSVVHGPGVDMPG
jgi:hypothetical protein